MESGCVCVAGTDTQRPHHRTGSMAFLISLLKRLPLSTETVSFLKWQHGLNSRAGEREREREREGEYIQLTYHIQLI